MFGKYVVSTLLLLVYPFSSFCVDSHPCIPSSVSVNYDANLMVLGCLNGSLNQGIDGKFFAYPISGPFFQSFLSLANAAFSTGRELTIQYDPAQQIGTSYDCITFGGCRPIVSLRQSVWSFCRKDKDCPDKKVFYKDYQPPSFGECIYPYSFCENSTLTTFARTKTTESCIPDKCSGDICRRNCYQDSDCTGGYTCDERTRICVQQ